MVRELYVKDELLLPPDAVLVHIGPHKTGTTALQATLAASRELLRGHGVDYPGTRQAHHQEAKSLRQIRTGWRHDSAPAPDPHTWSDLVRHVQSSPGRVVISSEFFAKADDAARSWLVQDLGAERVHILAAARNVGALALSTWQQQLKEGYPLSLDDWLRRDFVRHPGAQPNGFWSYADPAILTQRWAEVAGSDRVTVIVLDEADRTQLPSAFERMLGLPAGLLADRVPRNANRGLTAAEASLLRELDAAVEGKLSWSEYNAFVRNGTIRRLLEMRTPPSDEARPRLPTWILEQVVAEGRGGAEALRRSAVRVIGDPSALEGAPATVAESSLPTDVPVDAAVEALIGAVVAGTRRGLSLDDPRRPGGPRLAELTTRELVAVVRKRAVNSARRRLSGGRRAG